VVAGHAVGLGRVGARARARVAGAGVVTLVGGAARDGVRAHAAPVLAGVALRAGVAVVAGRAVGLRRVRAHARARVAGARRVAGVGGRAGHGRRRLRARPALARADPVAHVPVVAVEAIGLEGVGGAVGPASGAELRHVAL